MAWNSMGFVFKHTVKVLFFFLLHLHVLNSSPAEKCTIITKNDDFDTAIERNAIGNPKVPKGMEPMSYRPNNLPRQTDAEI